jgi:hypothetical protein
MDTPALQLKALGLVYYVVAAFFVFLSAAFLLSSHWGMPEAWAGVPLALAAWLALVGNSLRNCRFWSLCIVTAAVAILLFPVGTVIGVLTLLALARPEVKTRFEAA